MDKLLAHVNTSDPLFIKTASLIVLCPLIWNIVARTEYYYKPLRKLFGGNKYAACYAITAWVFCFSCYRDIVYVCMIVRLDSLYCLKHAPALRPQSAPRALDRHLWHAPAVCCFALDYSL